MSVSAKPRLAVYKFASCDGCQLSLLDCEDELLAVAGEVEIANFPEASRAVMDGPYDLTLVEGSVTTPHDAERIQEVRRQSRFLVTIGACATAGGIQALRNFRDVKAFARLVYARPDYIETLETSTAIAEHVCVDFELRGCPIDKRQLLEVITSFLHDKRPNIPDHSVCVDCKKAGIVCLTVSRGIACEPEDVLVVSGAQQALDLVARTLIDPGDVVAIENPGYFGAAWAFKRAGAELLPIEVDDRGLRTDALARALRSTRAKLVYTTPSAQVPTGVTLDAARREMLLELSDRHHVPVLEDDYDSELRFAGPPLPALKTRDPAGRVIYVGTFSKALFPGLRVGYVVAAPALLKHMAAARYFADMGGDVVSQVVVADLLASGALEKHVRRVRRLHAARRAALLDALGRCMPEGVVWTRPAAGRLVWLTLPDDVDPEALAAEAARAGIACGRGETCTLDDSGRRSLILSFVNESTDALGEGVAELADMISKLRRAQTSARAGEGR